jgi:hypothetical protein
VDDDKYDKHGYFSLFLSKSNSVPWCHQLLHLIFKYSQYLHKKILHFNKDKDFESREWMKIANIHSCLLHARDGTKPF